MDYKREFSMTFASVCALSLQEAERNWSGQTFDEPALHLAASFTAAEVHYTSADQIRKKDRARWTKKARDNEWDYKNIVKRRGKLERPQ